MKMIKLTFKQLRKIIREALLLEAVYNAWWITPEDKIIPIAKGTYHSDIAAKEMGAAPDEDDEKLILSFESRGAIRLRIWDNTLSVELQDLNVNTLNRLRNAVEELGFSPKMFALIDFAKWARREQTRTTVGKILISKTLNDLW